MKNSAKRLALCGLLISFAIVLGWVERMFPLEAVVPIPGARLGLANVITVFALTQLGLRDALSVVLCRVTLSALLFGGISSFLFSLLGGLLALLTMWLLLLVEGRVVSLVGVSIAGAAAHQIGQIVAAIVWMQTAAVVAYLPALLLLSIPFGFITGTTVWVILGHLKKINLHA